MSAHRYWALFFDAGIFFPTVSVASIEWRATPGGTNLATGGVAALRVGVQGSGFPTGTDQNGRPIANCFDGNVSTIWHNTGGSIRIDYDFGAPVAPQEVVVTTATPPGGAFNSSIQTLTPLWSDDGALWTATWPATSTFNNSPLGVTTLTGLDTALAPASARSVRLALPGAMAAAGSFAWRFGGQRLAHDPIDGGNFHLASDVAIEGPPLEYVGRRVRLFDKVSGRLVREQWSDPVTGAYDFRDIRDGLYFVTAEDHTSFFNAVIADRLRPVPQ